MKRNDLYKLIGMIVLAAVSITITVLHANFSDAPGYMLFWLQVFGLVGCAFIVYAYPISWFFNALHSMKYRKNSNDNDDEPSGYAIWGARSFGLILLVMQLVVPFLF